MRMKQIGARLEEELVKRAKHFTFDNGISLQMLVSEAITSYLDNNETFKQTNKPKQKPKAKEKEPKKEKAPKSETKPPKQPAKQDSVDVKTFGKPCYEGAPEKTSYMFTNGITNWYLEEGVKQYFDENRKPIPFSYVGVNGEIHNPTEEEIKIVEADYEQPVIFEK